MPKQPAADPQVEEGEVVEEGAEVRHLPAVQDRPTDASLTLFRTSDPVQVVKQAGEVAQALAGALEESGLVLELSFKGRKSKHVRVEGWTLLGSMLGVYPICAWSRRVIVDGRPIGWEARVEARRSDGALVGAAEAECLRTETRWEDADDYAVRSMAQTRATSKALRQPLGFVVSLAGYNATPAEEIPDDEKGGRKPSGGRRIKDPGKPATEPQVRAIATIAGKLDLTDQARLGDAAEIAGRAIRSLKDLTKGEASEVIEAFKKRLEGEEGGGDAAGGGAPSAPDASTGGSPSPSPSPEGFGPDEAQEWAEVLRQVEAGDVDPATIAEDVLARAAEVRHGGNRSKLLMAYNDGREPGTKARSAKQIPVPDVLRILLEG